MPTYEYHCDACGHEFELVQKITEPPIKKCEKCKKPKAHRLIAGGTFILKGSGWYADGYSSGSKSGSKSETKSESKSETKSESKSETKSETKSESKPEKKESAKKKDA